MSTAQRLVIGLFVLMVIFMLSGLIGHIVFYLSGQPQPTILIRLVSGFLIICCLIPLVIICTVVSEVIESVIEERKKKKEAKDYYLSLPPQD